VTLGDDIAIQVGRTSHVRSELLEYFRQRAFEFGGVLALIAIAGGVLITYAGLAPLRSLESTVRAIVQTGRYDARVTVTPGRDPLDALGGQINVMLERIQTLLGGMRGALDNVAHDLRTPLTRFRNVAEHALVSDDPAAIREGLARALEEADRVNATLNALIDISEAETGTMRLAAEAVDVKAVVEEAVALYADEADEKRIGLEMQVPPELTLTGDRTRLRQVVANLIENAVKYTDSGGRVEIDAAAEDPWIRLRVRDTGIGISESDLPLVWDRLYRADASRSARGLGLGLSLVKAIVEAHGGRVEVSSVPGQGSAFTVLLPLGSYLSKKSSSRRHP
jgi:signal transduction histidine kinase